MTGFGKAVVVYGNKKITAEIKSLNSKQLDLSIRLSQVYREKELELRNDISRNLERGKVDLFIYSESSDASNAATINIPLLKSYKAQIQEMSQSLEIALPEDWYATLLRMPDTLKTDSTSNEVDEQELNAVSDAVSQAVKALMDFRAQEGNRLYTFFKSKIGKIQELLNEVAPYENERVAKIKSRIQDSLAKLDGIDYDHNRFEQEMIYYIEKLDINEEKARLANHLNYFLETMKAASGQGKKLGFISQEIGREVNTMGSKSNHADMQQIVVRMKDELEQIKEQVLNVL